MANENEIRELVSGWHRSEDHLYRSVLQVPALYTSCVRLVRAVADSLSNTNDVDALLDSYERAAPDTVSSIADAMDLPRRDFLDYELALDAAFYLRYQEILEARAREDMQERVNRARSGDAEWAVLFEEETRSRGHTFFQRLEMHLPDGIGLRTSTELDWEKGRIYLVELIQLDPDTGQPKRGVPSPGQTQEFATRGEMMAAVEALRARYSTRATAQASGERGAPNG